MTNPANMPIPPEMPRSFARITRPILTLAGPRLKTEAEILRAADRETALLAGTYATRPKIAAHKNPRNRGPYRGKPLTRPPRPAFAPVTE